MGQAQQKRRAVLVVEDDAELRSLTAALLEDEKVDTIECDSAEVVPREPRPWHSPSDTLGRVLVCPNDTGNWPVYFSVTSGMLKGSHLLASVMHASRSPRVRTQSPLDLTLQAPGAGFVHGGEFSCFGCKRRA